MEGGQISAALSGVVGGFTGAEKAIDVFRSPTNKKRAPAGLEPPDAHSRVHISDLLHRNHGSAPHLEHLAAVSLQRLWA